MKLFGSSKSSRHGGAHAPGSHSAAKRPETGASAAGASKAGTTPAGASGAAKPQGGSDEGLNTLSKVFIAVASVMVVLAVVVVVVFATSVKPPEVTGSRNDPLGRLPSGTQTGGGTGTGTTGGTAGDKGTGTGTGTGSSGKEDGAGTGDGEDEPPTDTRSSSKYTFLAVGMDDGNGNTDTIMAATFDTSDYSLNVVSIPRDTLVNVSWNNKRVNSLYHVGKEEGLMNGIADIIGFRPDFYGIVELDAFIKLIDAIGGVDFEVPRKIDYDDPAQDLHIHFTKGMTHMTGQMAMEYMRFRKGYADQDIGRIHAQQDFLLTAAKQILANTDKVPVTTLVDIFMNDVKTSLTVAECTWFAKELLKMNFEDIHFYTMPGNYNDYAGGDSYVTINVESWLDMVNDYLNPFEEEITLDNVDILTKDSNGRLYATSGVRRGSASWG